MNDRARLPTIGPVLWYRDPAAAIDWLETAFGFERRIVVEGEGGSVMHSELTLGDGYIMVVGPPSDDAAAPGDIGGRWTQSVHLQLSEGIERHYARARAAGAVVSRELAVQPYGDQVYVCTDPEGHHWSVGQTVEVLSNAEVEAATGHKISSGARA